MRGSADPFQYLEKIMNFRGCAGTFVLGTGDPFLCGAVSVHAWGQFWLIVCVGQGQC